MPERFDPRTVGEAAWSFVSRGKEWIHERERERRYSRYIHPPEDRLAKFRATQYSQDVLHFLSTYNFRINRDIPLHLHRKMIQRASEALGNTLKRPDSQHGQIAFLEPYILTRYKNPVVETMYPLDPSRRYGSLAITSPERSPLGEAANSIRIMTLPTRAVVTPDLHSLLEIQDSTTQVIHHTHAEGFDIRYDGGSDHQDLSIRQFTLLGNIGTNCWVYGEHILRYEPYYETIPSNTKLVMG